MLSGNGVSSNNNQSKGKGLDIGSILGALGGKKEITLIKVREKIQVWVLGEFLGHWRLGRMVRREEWILVAYLDPSQETRNRRRKARNGKRVSLGKLNFIVKSS